MTEYPQWTHYPSRDRPPDWVPALVAVVASVRTEIDSATVSGITSDKALAAIRPGLEAMGFRVEAGKRASERRIVARESQSWRDGGSKLDASVRVRFVDPATLGSKVKPAGPVDDIELRFLDTVQS